MITCADQIGNTIHLAAPPQRIISLVPSQTELLFDLGLEETVVAITKFCVHPVSWYSNKIRIGGTKNVNIEKIKGLNPDLIIANKEENVKEQVRILQEFAPVWVSDVNNLDDALHMIHSIGEIVEKHRQAAEIVNAIRPEFLSLQPSERNIPAAYLIWKDPYMTIGGDTFINDMMTRCGFTNVFSHLQRYPEIAIPQLKATHCRFILLSSEPYPFKEQHLEELEALLPGKKIILVDGEMFSWYGSRLKYAPGYFLRLLQVIPQQ